MEILKNGLPIALFCCVLSHFLLVQTLADKNIRRRSPRKFLNRLNQETKKESPVVQVETLPQRTPRFGNKDSKGDSPKYVRVGNDGAVDEDAEDFISFKMETECGTTYLLEDGQTAIIYSRNDLYRYACENTFKAVGDGSNLHIVVPEHSFKFNCYFESLTIKTDDANDQYCGNDEIPKMKSKEVKVKYDRKLMGFFGGYNMLIKARGKSSTGENLTQPPTQTQQCGVTLEMEKKNEHHRIVGGTAVKRSDHPWVVLLKITAGYHNYEYRCAGSLISNYHILSAAHCFYGYDIKRIDVALGKNDLDVHDEDGAIWRMSTNFKIHKDYDDYLILHDIAIITLPEEVKFSEYIRPICLPAATKTIPDGDKVMASGWGALSYDGDQATVLQEVDLSMYSNSVCQNAWQTKFDDDTFGIFESQLCAMEPGKDTCSGDSGGPLIHEEEGQWVQVGITSYGYRCADPDVPAVYTRVSHYLDWINENMS